MYRKEFQLYILYVSSFHVFRKSIKIFLNYLQFLDYTIIYIHLKKNTKLINILPEFNILTAIFCIKVGKFNIYVIIH